MTDAQYAAAAAAGDEPECKLLSGGFAALMQVMLGFIAFSVLIVKRYNEVPQRPLAVWGFDASKQMVGAGFAHVANLLIAILLYQHQLDAEQVLKGVDQCAFYFVNFTMDTTFGVFLNWVFLEAFSLLAARFQWTSVMVTGDYGDPIRVRNWLAQLLSWIVIIFMTKLVIAVFIVALEKPLGELALWVFSPLKPYPREELALVMIACPCLMNALQFWIQDSFLKKDIRDDCVLVSSSSSTSKSLSHGDHVSEKSALTDTSSSPSSPSSSSLDDESGSSGDRQKKSNVKIGKLTKKPVELDDAPVSSLVDRFKPQPDQEGVDESQRNEELVKLPHEPLLQFFVFDKLAAILTKCRKTFVTLSGGISDISLVYPHATRLSTLSGGFFDTSPQARFRPRILLTCRTRSHTHNKERTERMEGPTGTEKIVLATATGAFFGAAIGSVESVWSIPKLGDKLPKFSTQIRQIGVRSLVFASVGAIYTTGEFASASIRQKNDQWNAGVGGLLVGVVPGVLKKNARVGAATSVVAAAAMTAATFWSGTQVTPFEKYAAARFSDRT